MDGNKMNQLSRRKFATGLGLFGLVTAAAAGFRESTVEKIPEIITEELEKQLDKNPCLQLNASYHVEKPFIQPLVSSGNLGIGTAHPSDNLYAYSLNELNNYHNFCIVKPQIPKDQINIKLIPGPDGNLYVKENGTWRRV